MTETTRTTLYFVRHAHSPYFPDREAERGLSDRGRADARRVTELLAPLAPEAVVSSPYARAVETVRGVADACDDDVVLDDGFRERRLAGSHVDDFDRHADALWADPTLEWPGGESHRTARQRGLDAVARTIGRYGDEGDRRIVIGTHGTLLALILGAYDDRYDAAFWAAMTMPDCYRVRYVGTESVEIDRHWPSSPSER